MNEEINLISVKLYTEYYKNNNIEDRYIRNYSDNTVIDNDVLKADYLEYVYITTLDKHNKLQQENKHLKDLQNDMDKQYAELEEENYTANKTINELSDQIAKLVEDKKQLSSKILHLETQQKEFIKYLEDGIKEAKDDRKSEWDYEIKFEINGYIDAYEEILSKYKEIVGDISE